ncbi:hypothetical protein TNCV_2414021 [Trichonephila clavipes]|nr:hypothetical protein TNCV_2414021 [Trichonephila clavipes]
MYGPYEHKEVPQHDVAWIQLRSEVVLEVIDTMNPAGQSINQLETVLLETLCSNSGRVGCRIVPLRLPKFVGMHNEHECVQVVRQDAYVPVTCQSSI